MAPLSNLFARLQAKSVSSSGSSDGSFFSRSLPASAKTTTPVNPKYSPGGGSINPHHINNHGFFALFALLGVAMVLGAIWFFFWARNGGFHFKESDWDEYKSTVLRRKGPNGTTLSGATKTTKLGGGSVVAEGNLDNDEKGWKRGEQVKKGRLGKGPRGNKNNDDNDVRAYRHEKAARVGGLNRESDAVGKTDFAYSDVSSQPEMSTFVPINTPRRPKNTQHPTTPSPTKNNKKSPFYATPGSNNSTDSHRPLRPNAATPGSGSSTPSRTRNPSPRKRESVPGSFYTDPLDFENRYSQSEAGISDDSRGTRSYLHPIAGLGTDNRRSGKTGGGFRRGGGRRDSLSDSEGETTYS